MVSPEIALCSPSEASSFRPGKLALQTMQPLCSSHSNLSPVKALKEPAIPEIMQPPEDDSFVLDSTTTSVENYDIGSAVLANPHVISLHANSLVHRPRDRSGSTPASDRARYHSGMLGKTPQENMVLALVRKHTDKLQSQILNVQKQCDRWREYAFSRIDQKMSAMEATQPKLERRLAELCGNYKGLSEEMQGQIGRTDMMESRLREWRLQLEEDIRVRLLDVEQNYQTIAVSLRNSYEANEESVKKHGHRVCRLEDRTTQNDECYRSLNHRVAAIEEYRIQDACAIDRALERPRDRTIDDEASISVAALDSRVSNVWQKMDNIFMEFATMRGRVEVQEEHVKALRTHMDAEENRTRWLTDRIERADWEGRVRELQQQAVKHDNLLDLVQKGFADANELRTEIEEHLQHLQDRFSGNMDVGGSTGSYEIMTPGGSMFSTDATDVKEWVTAELQGYCSVADITPRLSSLSRQLKDLTSKVNDQEDCVRDMCEKLGRIEATLKYGRPPEVCAASGRQC